MGPRSGVAARALLAGGLVVHPTDTLYALAARAMDRTAVARLVDLKGRAPGRPLSVAVSSVAELDRWALLNREARRFVRDQLPGPFTVLARPSPRARRTLAAEVADRPRIGLRVPAHPFALELARRVGPLVATSANRSGEPPARTLREARRSLGDRVACYADAAPSPSGRPSTLVDVAGRSPREVPRG